MKIEFDPLISLHPKYKEVILDEIRSMISSPGFLHAFYDEVFINRIDTVYLDKNKRNCSIEEVETISVNVKGDFGHFGIQIFLPKKIKKRRDEIIKNVLNDK